MKRGSGPVDVVLTQLAARDAGGAVEVPGGSQAGGARARIGRRIGRSWRRPARARRRMSYEDLPLTRLVGTAQERIAPDPEPVVLEIAQYGETDCCATQVAEPVNCRASAAANGNPGRTGRRSIWARSLQVTTGIVHRRRPRRAGRAGGGGCRPDAAEAGGARRAGLAGQPVLGLALAKAPSTPPPRTSWPTLTSCSSRAVGPRGRCRRKTGARGGRGRDRRTADRALAATGGGVMSARFVVISGRVQGVGFRQ